MSLEEVPNFPHETLSPEQSRRPLVPDGEATADRDAPPGPLSHCVEQTPCPSAERTCCERHTVCRPQEGVTTAAQPGLDEVEN